MKHNLKYVIGYIFLRWFIFILLFYLLHQDVKIPSILDIRDVGSALFLAWMLLFFPVVETLLLTVPFSFGLSKWGRNWQWSLFALLLFGVLFAAEFIIAVFAINDKVDSFHILKVTTSVVCFFLYFGRKLSGRRKGFNGSEPIA